MNKFLYSVMNKIAAVLGPVINSFDRVGKQSFYREVLDRYESRNQKLEHELHLTTVKNELLKKQNERLEMRNADLKQSVHILACDCLVGEVKNIKKDLLKI